MKYNVKDTGVLFFIYSSVCLFVCLLDRDLQRLASFSSLVSYPRDEKHPQTPNNPNAQCPPSPTPLALSPPLERERKEEEEEIRE